MRALRRYVSQVIAESGGASGAGPRPFYEFLEGCLRHKAEMVIFEAARAIVGLPEVTARELAPAVTVLQLFLTSSKPVLRFAAVRSLNKARARPPALTPSGGPTACKSQCLWCPERCARTRVAAYAATCADCLVERVVSCGQKGCSILQCTAMCAA